MTIPLPPVPLVIRLFGGFQVIVGGEDRSDAFLKRKSYQLLALLVLEARRGADGTWKRLGKDIYAANLWGQDNVTDASLRQSLSELRRALGAQSHRIQSGGGALALDLSDADVDVGRFQELLEKAHGDREIAFLKEAADLRTGPLLEGLRREGALYSYSRELDEAYFRALERIVEAARGSRDAGERLAAETYLQRHIKADPGRQDRSLLLMRLRAARGDARGALRVHDALVHWLNQNDERPEREVTAFYRSLLKERRQPDPPRAAIPFRHNIEERSFVRWVGDTSQSEQIRDYLLHTPRQSLWATLKGGPGMGKTLTAHRIAEEITRDFRAFFDGVWFVPLRYRPRDQTQSVAHAIAEALGLLPEETDDVSALLCEHLSARADLIVLDNCQHLLTEETYAFFHRLRRRCPRLSVLATSQEAPELPGSHVFRIRSLTPDEAAELFFLRAGEKGILLERSEETESLVHAVCRRAGHIPLAIEFASGLLEARSLEETAGTRGLLDLQPGGESPLQTSLGDAYAALDGESQTLLARLSLFSGWTWEAAKQVCSDESLPEAAFEKAHLQLIRRSLVEVRRGNPTWYDLAEVTREFAQTRLDAPGRERQRRRHARYYRTMMTRAETELEDERQTQVYDLLTKERDNLRAAQEWLISRPDESGDSLEIISLWRFWLGPGFIPEVRSWLAEGIRKARNAPLGIRVKFLEARTLQAYLRSEFEQAAQFGEEVYRLCRSEGDGGNLSRDLMSTCHALGAIYANLGYRSRSAEHEAKCRFYLEQGMAMATRADDDHQKALAHLAAGMKGWYDQELAAGRESLEECLRLLDSKKDSGWMLFASNTLGHVLRDQGAPAAAREAYRRGLELSRSMGQVRVMGGGFQGLAGLAASQGNYERAALLLGITDRLYKELHWKPLPPQVEDYERTARSIQEALGDARFFEGREMGGRLSLNDAFRLGIAVDEEREQR